jgi:hypothetical protein
LTGLRVLDLRGCRIEDEGLAQLAATDHLRSLTALRLGTDDSNGENGLTEDGIRELAASRPLSNLTQLDLNCNEFGDDGLRALLRSKHLSRLTELDLSCTNLTEDGLLALARSRKRTNLRRLDLRFNHVTTNAAEALLRSTALRQVSDLRLSYDPGADGLSADLVARLTARFGVVAVQDTEFEPTPVCEADRICLRARRADSDYHNCYPEYRVL